MRGGEGLPGLAPAYAILEDAEEGQPMSMIGFPLLLIPLAIVNIAVLLMGLELDGPAEAGGLHRPAAG